MRGCVGRCSLLADDEAQGVNGGDDEDPFGHAKLRALHEQARVQTEADDGVCGYEEDPFGDLDFSILSSCGILHEGGWYSSYNLCRR